MLAHKPILSLASSWQDKPEADNHAAGHTDDADAGVTLYQSGMHPWIITTEPGNCPICGMKLEPIDPAKLTGEVTIDPVVVQNFGVRTAEVTRGPVTRSLRALGTIEFAEPSVRDVNLRVEGWVEKLIVQDIGGEVVEGQPLFEINAPVLYAAQEALLATSRRNQPEMVQAVRDRLLNFGMTEPQVQSIIDAGKAERVVPILSPFTGVVIENNVNEGTRIDSGTIIFRIADTSTIWVQATVYEYQLPYVRVGLPATMALDALPGRSFSGEVVSVEPTVDQRTRAVRVRLVFENPGGELRPGMYADVTLTNTIEENATLAPREAVIDTGRRSLVFVSHGQGRFEPREVTVGFDSGDERLQVLDGLSPGEKVVVSGQFLLDSEASVRESLARMVRGDWAAQQKPSMPAMPASSNVVLDAAAQRQLDMLTTHYLAIQDALTRDKMDDVDVRLSAISNAASQLNTNGPDDLRPLAEAVARSAEIDTREIEAFREAFSPLSDAVIALVSEAVPGPAVGETLYITHCPMVDKDWLQTDDTVRNPYATYMLNCGEFKGVIHTGGAHDH